jgi:hypothetical protein
VAVATFNAGGGFSTMLPAPWYQTNGSFTSQYVHSGAGPPGDTYNGSNRGFPDLSAFGLNIAIIYEGEGKHQEEVGARLPEEALLRLTELPIEGVTPSEWRGLQTVIPAGRQVMASQPSLLIPHAAAV